MVPPSMQNSEMENLGTRRSTFALLTPPPSVQTAWKRRTGTSQPVEIFEPYEESLPLQSGYYSFVIDEVGHFHVKRGNTTSHAGMVSGRPAAAAGRFRVNRMGRVIEVVCGCRDYGFFFNESRYPLANYVIQAFGRHPAFALNPCAVFQFSTRLLESTYVTTDGKIIILEDYQERLKALENEGVGQDVIPFYGSQEISRYQAYTPPQPPTLYPMHRDQLILGLEESDVQGFDYGPAMPRLTPDMEPLKSGKNNFVIDREGWLIVGMTGHQILSGGAHVGGAGHITIETSGQIIRLEMNFSGHYRPPLTADYIRYIYRTTIDHPLLKVADNCSFHARKFDNCDANSVVYEFAREELASDDPELDYWIESL